MAKLFAHHAASTGRVVWLALRVSASSARRSLAVGEGAGLAGRRAVRLGVPLGRAGAIQGGSA